MREANKLNSKYVLFLGGSEYKQGLLILKNMSNGEEEKISLTRLDQIVKKIKTNPV
jgi:histidyl-tRNA synthetase